jgi:hypothetical protein
MIRARDMNHENRAPSTAMLFDTSAESVLADLALKMLARKKRKSLRRLSSRSRRLNDLS